MKRIIVTFLSFTMLISCTKNFEEINENKTAASTIDPELLFTRALVTGSGISYTVYQLIHQTSTSHYAQHWSNINPTFIGDIYGPGPNNGVWSYYYATRHFAPLLLNHEVKKLLNEGEQNPVKLACVDVWDVYLYSLLTDMFGDIPYSEAFLSDSPAYDTQEEIYKDLLRRLQEASVSIAENSEKGFKGFGEGDVLFEGDLNKWRKFANSLLLRLSMRVSNVDETLTLQYLSTIDANDFILDNASNAQMMMVPASEAVTHYVKNPMGFIYVWNEVRVSKLLMDWLDGTNTSGVIDPRMYQYAEPNSSGEYVGLANGQDPLDLQNDLNAYRNNYCNIGPFYNHQDEAVPLVLLGAAETNLLLAEASLKGFISGGLSADAYYNDGIRMSMEQYMVEGDVDAYLNANGVVYEAARAEEMILTQKWIALYANSLEAWNELRRTGYPVIDEVVYYYPGNPDMPRRFQYSTAEANYNTDNYNEAASRMGGDTHYSRMWWDVN